MRIFVRFAQIERLAHALDAVADAVTGALPDALTPGLDALLQRGADVDDWDDSSSDDEDEDDDEDANMRHRGAQGDGAALARALERTLHDATLSACRDEDNVYQRARAETLLATLSPGSREHTVLLEHIRADEVRAHQLRLECEVDHFASLFPHPHPHQDSDTDSDVNVEATASLPPQRSVRTRLCDHAECLRDGAQLKCSKCKSRRYCDAACQKADWKAGHKRQCQDASAALLEALQREVDEAEAEVVVSAVAAEKAAVEKTALAATRAATAAAAVAAYKQQKKVDAKQKLEATKAARATQSALPGTAWRAPVQSSDSLAHGSSTTSTAAAAPSGITVEDYLKRGGWTLRRFKSHYVYQRTLLDGTVQTATAAKGDAKLLVDLRKHAAAAAAGRAS
jgi:hypothetical protein